MSAIEGRNAVIEALRAGVPISRVLVGDGVRPDRDITEIERRCREAGVKLARVPKRELDALSERGAHQGVIAEAAPFRYKQLDDVLRAAEGLDTALIIALDHVTDPGNFGAVARTAEVVGALAVVTTKRRSAAITPAAYKTSAGAVSHIAITQEPNLVQALERCKAAGFWVAGASEHAEKTLWESPLEGRIVLVMGSEGEGLSRLVQETCDFLVSLPQAGKVGSLNVAQATTAIAYEWMRRREAKAAE